jgi:hypothetical protein
MLLHLFGFLQPILVFISVFPPPTFDVAREVLEHVTEFAVCTFSFPTLLCDMSTLSFLCAECIAS